MLSVRAQMVSKLTYLYLNQPHIILSLVKSCSYVTINLHVDSGIVSVILRNPTQHSIDRAFSCTNPSLNNSFKDQVVTIFGSCFLYRFFALAF
jgi:hypothetical protein